MEIMSELIQAMIGLIDAAITQHVMPELAQKSSDARLNYTELLLFQLQRNNG